MQSQAHAIHPQPFATLVSAFPAEKLQGKRMCLSPTVCFVTRSSVGATTFSRVKHEPVGSEQIAQRGHLSDQTWEKRSRSAAAAPAAAASDWTRTANKAVAQPLD